MKALSLVIHYGALTIEGKNTNKTYRKCLEKDQALYDAFHGVAGQAKRSAQMAPALADERRNTGRRLRGGGRCCCCCGCGGGDQRWRLADGGRASTDAGDHLADHVARRPTATHPHPLFQRFHQRTVCCCDGGNEDNSRRNNIRTTVGGSGDDTTLPSSSRLTVENRSKHNNNINALI